VAGEFGRQRFILLTMLTLVLLFVPAPALATEIPDVTVRLNGNEIYVATSLKPGQTVLDDIYEGLPKEIIFYIDLFRVWDIWPNEFVLGTKIVRTLKSDLIKREYVATSSSGNLLIEKRFKDQESMIAWTMSVPEVKLTNIRGLEPGTYFIKVTVESPLKKLPPVVGYILIFVKEKEFVVSRSSQTFQLNMK